MFFASLLYAFQLLFETVIERSVEMKIKNRLVPAVDKGKAMKKSCALIVSLLFFFTVEIAGASVIDFESTPADLGLPTAPLIDVGRGGFITQGFYFYTYSFAWIHTPQYVFQSDHAYNGTNFMSAEYRLNMRSSNGDVFTFSGFDGAESLNTSTYPQYAPSYILVTGTRPDSSSISAQFDLDMINDGSGSLDDYQAFTVPELEWTNLVSLTFTAGNSGGAYIQRLAIDNILVNENNSVPTPGAVWLLGSGLIGLVGFRRKFKKA